MSQFNHIHDEPEHFETCPFCGETFKYWVDDRSLYGGHDWEPLNCPYCGKTIRKISGGDSISIYTNKISD